MRANTALAFQNIRRLPADADAFVPWFSVGLRSDRPIPHPHPQQNRALAGALCWLCGRPRGDKGTFLVGVRGALERCAYEPPAHWVCAIYAATTWLPGGRLGWFDGPLPDPRLAWLSADDDRRGQCTTFACVLWQTDDWEVEARQFALGEPSRVEWYREGQPLAGIPFDPEDYLGALAERGKLLPLLKRLRPWLP